MPENKKPSHPRKPRARPAAKKIQAAPAPEPAPPTLAPEPRLLPPPRVEPAPVAPVASQKGSTTMTDNAFSFIPDPFAAFAKMQDASLTAANRTMDLFTNFAGQLTGMPSVSVMPSDKRFADEAWTNNPVLNTFEQSYLIGSRWFLDLMDSLKEIDPELGHRATFYGKQLADAASPANVPWLNPTVVQETVRTGGANWARGMQNLWADMLDGVIRQVPEGAFRVGKNIAVTPGKVIYRNKLMELIQYTPTTPQVNATPILITPPWINKYYILDLSPRNSMVKFLVDSGWTVFMISWKNPGGSMGDLTWEDYMSLGTIQAANVARSVTGVDKINMVGYCIGGLLLQTVLAVWAAKGQDWANTATYFATHQDFDNVGDLACFISQPEVTFLEWLMEMSGGFLDGKNMGATFDFLRANDLVWNYVINNYMLGKQPPAFDILAWNSDNTRVPENVHLFYLRNFFLEKKLAKPNALQFLGVGLDLKRLHLPTFVLATKEDHIVPWKSAYKMVDYVSSRVHFTLAESGHVAGVVNPPEAKARGYWCEHCHTHNPDDWLACAQKKNGSWWKDWTAWLREHSHDATTPPPMGNAEYPPLADAPGAYVLEK